MRRGFTGLSRRNYSATATKPKLVSWDTGSVKPPEPNLSKWQRNAPPASTGSGSGSFSLPRSDYRPRSGQSGSGLLSRRSQTPSQGPSSSQQQGTSHSGQRSKEGFLSGGQSWRNNAMPMERQRAPHMDRSSAPPMSNVRLQRRDWDSRGEKDGDKHDTMPEARENLPPRDLAEAIERAPSTAPIQHPIFDDFAEKGQHRNPRQQFKSRHSLTHTKRGNIVIPGPKRTEQEKAKAAAARTKKSRPALKKPKLDVFIPSTTSVAQLAQLLSLRLPVLQRKMKEVGMESESSPSHVLTSEYAALLAEEFHRNPVVNDEAAFDLYAKPAHPSPETLPARPPIVTIMGHVDHGKTTLLDTLRSASVAKGEAGGITQHIGAFSVPVAGSKDERTITFLDTPGHAAFSAMRARGASVTDIIVLVVAADDGIMPQTKEVINLIKQDEGKTQVVVAINKIDKPEADPESVHTALLSEGIQIEAMGGDIPSVEVSGLTGKGLDQLVETLSAIAEMQDMRAERDGDVQGYVLESKVQKGLGPVATVLVTRGALTIGSHLIAGTSWAKVRVMNDSTGAQLKAAYPGMAVTVSGWKELPSAGDEVLQGTEGEVKKAIGNRVRKAEIEASLVDLEAINGARMQERMKRDEDGNDEVPVQKEEDEKKQLNLVIKGDVSGSVEALQGVLEEIGNDKVSVKVVSTGVGEVSDSDVQMAKVTGGMIVAFSVKTPRAVENAAASAQVPLYSTNIIYRAMEEVTNRVVALLPTTTEFKVHGEATVLQVFDIGIKSKVTRKVAGCRITNGVVSKYTKARLLRKGEVLFTGSIDTLRQHKNDMTEIKKGSECAIGLESFGDIREGDTIETYEEVKVPGVL